MTWAKAGAAGAAAFADATTVRAAVNQLRVQALHGDSQRRGGGIDLGMSRRRKCLADAERDGPGSEDKQNGRKSH